MKNLYCPLNCINLLLSLSILQAHQETPSSFLGSNSFYDFNTKENSTLNFIIKKQDSRYNSYILPKQSSDFSGNTPTSNPSTSLPKKNKSSQNLDIDNSSKYSKSPKMSPHNSRSISPHSNNRLLSTKDITLQNQLSQDDRQKITRHHSNDTTVLHPTPKSTNSTSISNNSKSDMYSVGFIDDIFNNLSSSSNLLTAKHQPTLVNKSFRTQSLGQLNSPSTKNHTSFKKNASLLTKEEVKETVEWVLKTPLIDLILRYNKLGQIEGIREVIDSISPSKINSHDYSGYLLASFIQAQQACTYNNQNAFSTCSKGQKILKLCLAIKESNVLNEPEDFTKEVHFTKQDLIDELQRNELLLVKTKTRDEMNEVFHKTLDNRPKVIQEDLLVQLNKLDNTLKKALQNKKTTIDSSESLQSNSTSNNTKANFTAVGIGLVGFALIGKYLVRSLKYQLHQECLEEDESSL